MSVIYALALIAGCAVLTWAGLEKIRDREPLTTTLVQLGAPVRAAAVAAVAVPLAELCTVALVAGGVRGYLPGSLFAALGAGFAGAAGWSLLSGRRVACACFGASARELGWPQLAALPLWLFAAWSAGRAPGAGERERLAILAGGLVVLTVVRSVPVLRDGITIRDERHRRAEG